MVTGPRRSVFDIAGILAAAGVLSVVHVSLPGDLQAHLAFAHDRFRIYTLLTYAFVHTSNAHLYGNLVGYLLATSYAYWLCLEADVRTWFRHSSVAIVLVVPVLTALTSFAIFSLAVPGASPTERGFSGVVAGFGGFLLVALAVYLRERYDPALGNVVAVSVLLVLAVEIDTIYAGALEPRVAGLAGFGIVLMIGSYLWERDVEVELERDESSLLRPVVSSGLVIVVLSVLVFLMFPRNVTRGGGFTNIVAHAAGFAYGTVIAVLVFRIPSR